MAAALKIGDRILLQVEDGSHHGFASASLNLSPQVGRRTAVLTCPPAGRSGARHPGPLSLAADGSVRGRISV